MKSKLAIFLMLIVGVMASFGFVAIHSGSSMFLIHSGCLFGIAQGAPCPQQIASWVAAHFGILRVFSLGVVSDMVLALFSLALLYSLARFFGESTDSSPSPQGVAQSRGGVFFLAPLPALIPWRRWSSLHFNSPNSF